MGDFFSDRYFAGSYFTRKYWTFKTPAPVPVTDESEIHSVVRVPRAWSVRGETANSISISTAADSSDARVSPGDEWSISVVDDAVIAVVTPREKRRYDRAVASQSVTRERHHGTASRSASGVSAIVGPSAHVTVTRDK